MFGQVELAENARFFLDGVEVSRDTARSHWLEFDANRGADREESSLIFSSLYTSEESREMVLDSGVEVIICSR